MFTGIIEAMGKLTALEQSGSNTTFLISSPISGELKPDQSVSHNGVCLTVEEVIDNQHRVTAIAETLNKTDLGAWKPGDLINLERCLVFNGRLDGHLVQGHVDATGICTARQDMGGSWQYTIEYPEQFAAHLIEKGSIALNGISLTVFNVTGCSFDVAIIPYTFEHTNMQQLVPGNTVNLEFDVIGKYVQRFMELKMPSQ
jgi:riboflavin synthase